MSSSVVPPFSYSGGKSQIAGRIVNLLRYHFPTELRLHSPFLGGGAVELRHCHARRGSVVAGDADPHVVMCWQALLDDAPAVARQALAFMEEPMTKARWDAWYAEMLSCDWHSVEDAAKYFIMRYTKVVHAWNWWETRAQNFNKPAVFRAAFTRLSRFRAPRVSVEHADFREFLDNHDGVFYCDPPYYSDDKSYEKVYEKRYAEDDNIFTNAAHEALAERLTSRRGWLLSYSPHDWVKSRYRDYPQLEVAVSYQSRCEQKRSNRDTELLILCK